MSQSLKDQKIRNLYARYELQRLQIKAQLHDSLVSSQGKIEATNRLQSLPRNSSITRVRNRCAITGRGRGVLRFCRLSRIMVRQHANKGFLPGVQKCSW